MKGQLSLADAVAEGETGMTAADTHAPEPWKDRADRFLHHYLLSHPSMHVDDLWAAGLDEPDEGRALGARFQTAARNGWMVKDGTYRPSVRSHGTAKPVWRSLVYRGG